MDSNPTLYSGRFSDGQTAGTTDVHIALREAGLAFWSDADGNRFWHFDKLTTAHPVRAGDPDVLIQYPEMPGATLFVQDREFIRELSLVADHTSVSSWFWRFTKPALAIVAVLVTMFGAVWLLDLSPARALAQLMPQKVRVQLGETLFESFTEKRKVCHSAAGDAALNKMFNRLTRGDPNAKLYSVRIVDWKLQNAFALPGGKMILTRGLIESAASAEEVTGVLAHEIGHVVKLHPEVGVVRAMGLTVAAQFIFAGGSETLGGIGTLLVALQFNRAAEREADHVGLELLEKSEVAPEPLAGFFERLMVKFDFGSKKKKSGEDAEGAAETSSLEQNLSKSLELLSTHPPSEERITLIRSRATYPTRPVLTAEEWKALQTICKS